MLALWLDLKNCIYVYSVTDEPDTLLEYAFIWYLCLYSSFHQFINFCAIRYGSVPYLWKILVPPKKNLFLRLLARNRRLARDDAMWMTLPTSTALNLKLISNNHMLFEYVLAKKV